jgi:hypothetical protein
LSDWMMRHYMSNPCIMHCSKLHHHLHANRIMRLRLNGSDHRTIKQSQNHQISVSTH